MVTFDFIKFSFSGTLLAWVVFFFCGTAESREVSGSIDYYLGGSGGESLDIPLGYAGGGGLLDISLDGEVRSGP